jgi:NAD binding domain of 6-phosphogluconate dehydrogenase
VVRGARDRSSAWTCGQRRDVAVVDAPLGGSREDARNGRLLSFAGGSTDDVDRVRPVLETIDAVASVYVAAVREYGEVDGELLGARHAAHRAGVDFGS